MAPMKRKGTFAKRSAKRTCGNVSTVVEALAHSDALPVNLRSLLKQTLPIVLNANKADRHAFEVEVVTQAEQALGAVQASLKQAHQTALTTQNEVIAPAERAKRTAAKAAAHAHLEATKAKLEEDKAALKAAEKAVEDAADHLKSAQKEDKAAEKELNRYVAKKATLTGALEHEFVMLKDGSSTGAEGRKAVQKLLALGKEHIPTSITLLHTLPITCKKPAASRSEFDNMTLNQLQNLLNGVVETLSGQVAGAEPVKAAKLAAVAAATDSLNAAQAALKAASDGLNATKEAAKEAAKEVTRTDHHLRKLWEDMRHVCEAQDTLTKDVKNFQEHVLKAFQDAKNREPAPEPVPEPEAVSEAPAPEA